MKRYTMILIILSSTLIITIGTACNDNDSAFTPVDDKTLPVDDITHIKDVVITIGNLTDVTGPASNALTVITMSLEDTAEYYNKQYLIPGVTFEVITYDGQYDPSRDIPGYEWLMERRNLACAARQ